MRGYPKGFLTFLLVFMAITLISGLLILSQALDLKFMINIPNPIPEDFSIPLAFFHSFISIILLFMIGSLWAYHMCQGWRKKENIISGIALCIIFSVLFLSAMGLYYFSTEEKLAIASIIHIVMGIIVIIAFLVHYLHFLRKSNLKKAV